jgi:hypothetical protein
MQIAIPANTESMDFVTHVFWMYHWRTDRGMQDYSPMAALALIQGPAHQPEVLEVRRRFES